MYLKSDGFSGYDRHGQQVRQRGLFLMLIQPPGVEGCDAPIKACVRKVALHQAGHWMMGTARIYDQSYTVSGSYGADGLTMSVPQEVYDRLPVTLPDDLRDAWNKGGGHNSAGGEAQQMREWALENLEALRK